MLRKILLEQLRGGDKKNGVAKLDNKEGVTYYLVRLFDKTIPFIEKVNRPRYAKYLE